MIERPQPPILNVEGLYLKTMQNGFAVEQNALPADILKELQQFAQNFKDRRTEITGPDFRSSQLLIKLSEMFSRTIPAADGINLSVAPNAAVLKHYDPKDTYISGAYEFHRDPEKYSGIFILVTVSGEAFLEIKNDKGRVTEIECRPNTLVTILANNGRLFPNENPEHRISRPKNNKQRDMLFLGMKK
jgi:hypothetical protein